MTGKNERTRPRPSTRDRYRYIAFRLETDADVRRPDMIDTIKHATHAQHVAVAEPWLTRFDGARGILRVLRGHEAAGKALLESITEVKGSRGAAAARVVSLLTSGTIASLQRKAFGGDRIDA